MVRFLDHGDAAPLAGEQRGERGAGWTSADDQHITRLGRGRDWQWHEEPGRSGPVILVDRLPLAGRDICTTALGPDRLILKKSHEHG
jgi:hypothetical protein